jgi:hypothetical protein
MLFVKPLIAIPLFWAFLVLLEPDGYDLWKKRILRLVRKVKSYFKREEAQLSLPF